MNYILSKFKMLSENEDEENSNDHGTFVSTESLPVATSSRTQVFLRIRPTSLFLNDNNNDVYKVEEPSTLLVRHFSSNDVARRSKFNKLDDNVRRKKFKFSKIFTQDSDQSQLFNEAIKPIVVDFLNNQDSTIISYGTAAAGKTFTLFGLASQPGVIPRSIKFILSSLDCTTDPWYKPCRFNSVAYLNENDRNLEIDLREKLLSCKSVDKCAYEEAYNAIENSVINKSQDISENSLYSLWISFIEIYNDTIFDLLEVDEEGKKVQLKLAIDQHGVTYIQGVRNVCITSGLEAFQILSTGQMRLSTVSTADYKSSKSHSIFTIKLLKYEKDFAPSEVEVCSISFCDLAGTGKIQKLASSDKELKESRSINTSLLALGRCLKVVAEDHSKHSTGPFRDSKLTRLFQRSLCGKENIILLVNINPTLDIYAETQSVLKFASLAMKLTAEFTKEDKSFVDFHTPITSPKTQESRTLTNAKVLCEEEINDIIIKNKQLLTKLKDLKSAKFKNEFEIRQELADFYSKKFKELDENWKNRILALEEEKECLLKFSVDQIERYFKEKLEECTNCKSKITAGGDYEEHLDVKIFEKDNSHYTSKILSFRKSLESIKNENNKLNSEKNQCIFQLSHLKKILKKFSDRLDASCETLENATDFEISNFMDNNAKFFLDEETITYLMAIKKCLIKSLEFKVRAQTKSMNTKSVQCNLNYSIIIQFCKEIQELLNPKSVKLPDIDDSSIISKDIADEDVTETTILMNNIKELINENVSKIIKMEVDNTRKTDELNIIKSKLEQKEREISKVKSQNQELEYVKFFLSEKFESLKTKINSKEIVENFDLFTIEPENPSPNEPYHQKIFTQLNSQYSFNDDFRLSLSESDFEKINRSAMRSSSIISKNDSGLSSSIGCSVYNINEEKCCQTNTLDEEDKSHLYQKKLLQLKLDYRQMTAQHYQESLRVAELSQELEDIRKAMATLKENTVSKEPTIFEYEKKLNANKVEIEYLMIEKQKLETKCNEYANQLKKINMEFEKKLTESQVRLKVHEEGENRIAKCLEDYWEKSVNLKSELSIVNSQLEKTSIKCFKEHVLQIDKLKEKLNEKELNQNKLEEKIYEYEKDLAEVKKLSEKVNDFQEILDRMQKEKFELSKLLNERSESQLKLEEELHKLTKEIESRDSQILIIKSDVSMIIRTNLSNSRKAKQLGKEAAKLTEKIFSVKENIIRSEEILKDLEENSSKEISNLQARLTMFEKNTELLNLICDTSNGKQSEIEKLKTKLLEKEKELELLKKNRHATIQRYDCLVRQLRDALRLNLRSSKLKKIFPQKQKYFFNNRSEDLVGDIHDSEPQIYDWKTLDDEHICSPYFGVQVMPHASTFRSSEITVATAESTSLTTDISEKYLEILY